MALVGRSLLCWSRSPLLQLEPLRAGMPQSCIACPMRPPIEPKLLYTPVGEGLVAYMRQNIALLIGLDEGSF